MLNVIHFTDALNVVRIHRKATMDKHTESPVPPHPRHELHPDGDGRFTVRLVHSDGRIEKVVSGYALFDAQQAMQRGDAYQRRVWGRALREQAAARAKGEA